MENTITTILLIGLLIGSFMGFILFIKDFIKDPLILLRIRTKPYKHNSILFKKINRFEKNIPLKEIRKQKLEKIYEK